MHSDAKSVLDKSHGGKRTNAGRKSNFNEKTVVIRVPASKADEIKASLIDRPNNDSAHPEELKSIQIRTQLSIPSPLESVAAGFPSPAQDDIEQSLDLNEYLIHHPLSTFILRVNSLSMKNAGIDAGDQILIDRSLDAEHGDIVLALIHNEFTVKRLMVEKSGHVVTRIWLKAENPNYPNIYFQEQEELIIWGVVTCIIKKLK